MSPYLVTVSSESSAAYQMLAPLCWGLYEYSMSHPSLAYPPEVRMPTMTSSLPAISAHAVIIRLEKRITHWTRSITEWSSKPLNYHPHDPSEGSCFVPVAILRLYHNGERRPPGSKYFKEVHGLVPRSIQCLCLCTCSSVGWCHCGKGKGSSRASCYLLATQRCYILSPRNFHHRFLCEKFTVKATSPTSTPPNHREFAPISRQEVVIFTRLQGTLQ
jgi:hypothetical protein